MGFFVSIQHSFYFDVNQILTPNIDIDSSERHTSGKKKLGSINHGEKKMDQIKAVFTATAIAIGGRNGHSEASDGSVNVNLSLPKEMGGLAKENTTTPEHLFAAGYAACFGGALDFVARQHQKDATQTKVICSVSIGPRDGGGFGLAVHFKIENSQLSQTDLNGLVKEAHEKICPYSHATRGNIKVDFEINGNQLN